MPKIYRPNIKNQPVAGGLTRATVESVANSAIQSNSSTHITIIPHAYDSVGTGDWQYRIDNLSWSYFNYNNDNVGDGDSITYKANLSVGTWTCRIILKKADYCGILGVYWSGTKQGEVDCYAAVDEPNAIVNYTITVTSDSAGWDDLKLQLDGKNASASDYAVELKCISLWKTS